MVTNLSTPRTGRLQYSGREPDSVWIVATLLVANLMLCSSGYCDDWPGWMGPNQDGVYRETGVIHSIPDQGLPIRWRAKVAMGYAGPAVADERVFVFDYLPDSGDVVNDPGKRVSLIGKERLTALHARTGKRLWRHEYDCPYSISYPSGPRCTPLVHKGQVYTLGSEGDLRCLNAATGKVQWSRNLKTDFAAEVPIWGFCSHPFIHRDLLYVMVGGPGQGVVAMHPLTGQVAWKALDTKAGYCPLSIINAGGAEQLIAFHPKAVSSLNPLTGQEFWSIDFVPDYDMSITKPVKSGDLLFASSIYNQALMIRLDKDQPAAAELWRGEPKNALHCANSTPSFVDNVVYGTDCVQGSMIAMDASDGERLWSTFQPTQRSEKRFVRHGTAFLTRIGDTQRYFLFGETGELIVAELTPTGYTEYGRFAVLKPTGEAFGRKVVWSHPAYANRSAYIRNDVEIVAVKLEQPAASP